MRNNISKDYSDWHHKNIMILTHRAIPTVAFLKKHGHKYSIQDIELFRNNYCPDGENKLLWSDSYLKGINEYYLNRLQTELLKVWIE
jgi:hypothetical protein